MNFWPKNRFFSKTSFLCFDICFRNFQPFEPKIVVCDPEAHSNTFLKFLDRWTEFDSFEINVLLVQGVICMFCMDFSGYCRDFSRFLKNLANLQNLHERNPWSWCFFTHSDFSMAFFYTQIQHTISEIHHFSTISAQFFAFSYWIDFFSEFLWPKSALWDQFQLETYHILCSKWKQNRFFYIVFKMWW